MHRVLYGRLIPAALGLLVLVTGCAHAGRAADLARPMPVPTTTGAPTTTPPPPVSDIFTDGLVVDRPDDDDLWLAWSLRDRTDQRRIGTDNAATERTNAESSMKAWITLDFLRVAHTAGRAITEDQQDLIDSAIRASDDQAAERLYRAAGDDRVLRDLQSVCQVRISTSRRGYWSFAQITAEDAVDILDCVLDKAPQYPGGDKLVADLHSVTPEDAFGIPQALPPGTPVAVKNGWTQHGNTGLWNVNCVASWRHYTLAVLTRYSEQRSLDYGAGICRDVTKAVLARLPDS